MQTPPDDFVKEMLNSKDDAVKLLAAFVPSEKMIPFYLKVMENNCNGNVICFNINAFFLGMIYFVYNKLYLSGFVIFLIGVVIPYLLPEKMIFMTLLVMSTIAGALFPQLYLNRFFRIVRKAGYRELPFDEVLSKVKKEGGKDNAAYVIFAATLIIAVTKAYLFKYADY